MIVGINKNRSQKAELIAATNEGIYASIGVHPHDAKYCGESTLKAIRSLAKNPKVRAWGEIGLDFNRMYSPKQDQEQSVRENGHYFRLVGESGRLRLRIKQLRAR